MGSPAPSRAVLATHLFAIPLALAALAWGVQHSALDATLARGFFDAARRAFVGRDNAVVELLGHQAARALPIVVAAIALAIAVAGGFVERLRPWRVAAAAVAGSMLLVTLAISGLKLVTAAHCPYALDVFGGSVDYAVERDGAFWAASRASAGGCLPSAHAGGGFSLLALYFAGWLAGGRSLRWGGLALGFAAGVGFGLVRMSQGSHFASQALWSAAVAWTLCAAVFTPLLARARASPR